MKIKINTSCWLLKIIVTIILCLTTAKGNLVFANYCTNPFQDYDRLLGYGTHFEKGSAVSANAYIYKGGNKNESWRNLKLDFPESIKFETGVNSEYKQYSSNPSQYDSYLITNNLKKVYPNGVGLPITLSDKKCFYVPQQSYNNGKDLALTFTDKLFSAQRVRITYHFYLFNPDGTKPSHIDQDIYFVFQNSRSNGPAVVATMIPDGCDPVTTKLANSSWGRIDIPNSAKDKDGNYRTDIGYTLILDVSFFPNTDNFTIQPDAVCSLTTATSQNQYNCKVAYDYVNVDICPRYVCTDVIDVCAQVEDPNKKLYATAYNFTPGTTLSWMVAGVNQNNLGSHSDAFTLGTSVVGEDGTSVFGMTYAEAEKVLNMERFQWYDGVMLFVNSEIDGIEAMSSGHISTRCVQCYDNDAKTEVHCKNGCSVTYSEVHDQIPLPKYKFSGNKLEEPKNVKVYYVEGKDFVVSERKEATTANFFVGKTYTLRTEIYKKGDGVELISKNLLTSCDQTFSVVAYPTCPDNRLKLKLNTELASNTEILNAILATKGSQNSYYKTSCNVVPGVALNDIYTISHDDTHDNCDEKPYTVYYHLLAGLKNAPVAVCPADVVVNYPLGVCPKTTLNIVVDDATDVKEDALLEYVKQQKYYDKPCDLEPVEIPGVAVSSYTNFNYINTHKGDDCSTPDPQPFRYNITDASGNIYATCNATVIVNKGACQHEYCGVLENYNVTLASNATTATPGTRDDFPLLTAKAIFPQENNPHWYEVFDFEGRYTENPLNDDGTVKSNSDSFKENKGLNAPYSKGTTYVLWSVNPYGTKIYCFQTITVTDACSQKSLKDYGVSISTTDVCYNQASPVTFNTSVTPKPNAYVLVNGNREEFGQVFNLPAHTSDFKLNYQVKDVKTGCVYDGSVNMKVKKPVLECSAAYNHISKRSADGTFAIPYPVADVQGCASKYDWTYTVTDKDGNVLKDKNGNNLSGAGDKNKDSLVAQFPDGYFKVNFSLHTNFTDPVQTCTMEYFFIPELDPCNNANETADFVNLVGNDLSGWNLSYGTQDRFGDYYFDPVSARENYYLDLWGKQRLYCSETGITVGHQRKQAAFSYIPVSDWGRIIDTKFVINDKYTDEYIWADKWDNYYGTVAGSGSYFAPNYNSNNTAELVSNVYRISYKTRQKTYLEYTCQSSDYAMPVKSGATPAIFGPQFSATDANAAHFYLNSDVTAYDPLFGNTYAHTTSKAEYQLLKTVPDGYATSMRVGASSVPFHNSGYLPKAGGAEFYGLNNFNLAVATCTSINNAVTANSAGKVTYSFKECEANRSPANKTATLNLALAPVANAAADRAQTTFVVDAERPYLLVNYASVLGVDVSDFPYHKGDYCSDIDNTYNNTFSHVGKEANFSILVEVQFGDDWITLPNSIINSAPITQLGTGNNSLANLNRNYESNYFHQATFNLDNACSATPAGLGFKQTAVGISPLKDGNVTGTKDQHNEAFVTTGWQALCFDLSEYVGKKIRFSVQNADCNDLAGHACYHSAYTYFNARHFDFNLQYCPKTERIDVRISKGFNNYAFRLISGNDTTPLIGVNSHSFAFKNVYGHQNGNPRLQLFANGVMIIDTAVVSTAPETKIEFQPESYTSTSKIVKLTDATTFASGQKVNSRTWKVYDANSSLTEVVSPLPSNTNYTTYTDESFSLSVDNNGQWVYLIVENNNCCSDTDSVFVNVANYQPAIACVNQGRSIFESDFASGSVEIDGIYKLDKDACIEDPVFTLTATSNADGSAVSDAQIDVAHRSVKGRFNEGYYTITITATMCGTSATCSSTVFLTKAYEPCHSKDEINLYSYDVVGTSFENWKLSYGSQDRYFRSFYNDHEARKHHAEVCKGLNSQVVKWPLSSHTNWNKKSGSSSHVMWVKHWNNFYGTVDGNTISSTGWSPSIDFNTAETPIDYVYNVDPETNGGTDADFDRQLKVLYRDQNKHPIISNFKTEGDIENYRFYIYNTNPGFDPLFGTVYKHTMLDDDYQLLPVMPSVGYSVIRVGSSTVPFHNNNTHFNFMQRNGCSEWGYFNYNSYANVAACGDLFPKFPKKNTHNMGSITFANYDPETQSYYNTTASDGNMGLAPNGHGTADRAQRTFIIDDDNKDYRLRYASVISVDITHVGCHYNARSQADRRGGRGPNTSVILEVKHDGEWIRMPQSLIHMRSIERLPFENNNDDARDIYFRREGFLYNGKGEVEQEDNFSLLVNQHASNFDKFHQANFDVDDDEGCLRPQGLGYEELTKKVLTTSAEDAYAAEFSQENHNESYITTGWQPLEFNLEAYVGDSARLTIEAADCTDRSGTSKDHGAYIYVTSLPSKARIIYCKSTGMINGVAEKGYSNYYVRFVNSTDTTPKILLPSNYFALRNPLKTADTKIEIYGDDYLMQTLVLVEFSSANFEEQQNCYFNFDFKQKGEIIEGTTLEYHIYDYDENLTADVKPDKSNTNYKVIADTVLYDYKIHENGQWVYLIAKNGTCCSDTDMHFVVPDPTIHYTCNAEFDLGTISIDSCAISIAKVLEIAKLKGFEEPYSSLICPAARAMVYSLDNKNWNLVTDDNINIPMYPRPNVYYLKWRFINKDHSEYTCPKGIKFKVEYLCPLTASAGQDLGVYASMCENTLEEIEEWVLSKLTTNPINVYSDCFTKKQIHWSTDAKNVFNDITSDMRAPATTTNHTFRYVISGKNCDYNFTVQPGICPFNNKVASYTYGSDLAKVNLSEDNCDNNYKYKDLVPMVRKAIKDAGYAAPSDGCEGFTWKAWDNTTEVKLTDNVPLKDKQYVGWTYKVDGTEYFCKYLANVMYKCPLSDASLIESLYLEENECPPTLGEVVKMAEDKWNITFPDSSANCIDWYYYNSKNTTGKYTSDDYVIPIENNQYVGWTFTTYSGDKQICRHKINVTYQCPLSNNTLAGDFNLQGGVCAPTQGELVEFVENQLGLQFPDTIGKDCIDWYYYPKDKVPEQFSADKRTKVADAQFVGWKIKTNVSAYECKYKVNVKFACPTNKNNEKTIGDLYLTNSCSITEQELVNLINAEQDRLGFVIPDTTQEECISWWYYKPNSGTALKYNANAVVNIGDNQNFEWKVFHTDGKKNECKYSFNLKDHICPSAMLDTIYLDEPTTKAGLISLLADVNPKTYSVCSTNRTLTLDESSLREIYNKGEKGSIVWNVTGKNYTCEQGLVVNTEPFTINCTNVAATRFRNDSYSIPLPTVDLGETSCSTPLTWSVKVYDGGGNDANDITSSIEYSIVGDKVNAKAPFGYSYWTFKAYKCSAKSNSCSQQVFMVEEVEPCK